MNRARYDDIVCELHRIAMGYGKKLESSQIDFWMRILKAYEHGPVMAALQESCSVCKHMPRPADVIDIIKTNLEKNKNISGIEFVDKGNGKPWDPFKSNTATPCHPKIALAWKIFHKFTGLQQWNVDTASMDLDLVLAVVNQQAAKHGIPEVIPEDFQMSERGAVEVIQASRLFFFLE